MNFDEINDVATKFGLYQVLLLLTIWWGNIVMVCNVVFMVFGEASKKICTNATLTNETYQYLNGSENVTFTNFTKHCQESYVFYSMIPAYGIESNTWITPLMTSIQLAGALVGSLLGGQIADVFGRKLNTWFWIVGMVLFTSLSIFAKSWPIMTAFRFFIGIATGGYLSSAVILVMEWMNERTRLPVQLSFDMIQSVGFIWMSLLAYLTKDWKTLSLVVGLQGIPLIIVFWFIMDPPIWLFQRQKFGRLASTIKTVAKVNRKAELKKLSKNSFAAFESNDSAGQPMIKSTYFALFSTRKLIQYSLMNVYSFFITGTIAYLLIFNVGNLVGNIFLNFALLGSVNIAAALITLIAQHVLKLGRRPIHQAALNGVWISLRDHSVIIVLYILRLEVKASGALTTAALIGSMFSFPLWTICNLYSGELYPTHMRNMGNGIGGFSANLGGILAPQILSLFKIWKPTPFIVGVVLTVLNAALAFFFLPETRGKFQESHSQSDLNTAAIEEENKDEKDALKF